MVRNITEIISREKRTIRQTISEYHKRALYKRARVTLEYLLPAMGSCLYLFTIGIFQKKSRELIYYIWEMIHPQLFAKKYVSPVEITSLVPNSVSLRLYEQAEATANISFEELFVLVEFLQMCQPTACFEIGTFDGRTTLNMAGNTSDDAIIYTLDLPREQIDSTIFKLDPLERFAVNKETSGARYCGTTLERKIQQLYGDSASFDYTPYKGKIDLVFVDGSHTYEYVLSDSRNAISLLRSGKGAILWHDYPTTSSVLKAINYLQANDPRFADIRYIKGTRFAYLICG